MACPWYPSPARGGSGEPESQQDHVDREPRGRSGGTDTNNGSRVAQFSLATSRQWTTQGGEKQEKTEWHRCVAWNTSRGSGLADTIEKYLKKGDRVYVEGRIEYRTYEDKDKQTRYVTEVNVRELVMLSGRSPGKLAALFDVRRQLWVNGGEAQQERRRAAAVTRQLRLLRAHGLLRKVSGTHRYVVTEHGRKVIIALLAARQADVEQLAALAA